jgi:hypothetical protein
MNDQIAFLKSVDEKLSRIDITITDDEYVNSLLYRLHTSWECFRAAIDAQATTLSPTPLEAKMLQESEQRENSSDRDTKPKKPQHSTHVHQIATLTPGVIQDLGGIKHRIHATITESGAIGQPNSVAVLITPDQETVEMGTEDLETDQGEQNQAVEDFPAPEPDKGLKYLRPEHQMDHVQPPENSILFPEPPIT